MHHHHRTWLSIDWKPIAISSEVFPVLEGSCTDARCALKPWTQYTSQNTQDKSLMMHTQHMTRIIHSFHVCSTLTLNDSSCPLNATSGNRTLLRRRLLLVDSKTSDQHSRIWFATTFLTETCAYAFNTQHTSDIPLIWRGQRRSSTPHNALLYPEGKRFTKKEPRDDFTPFNTNRGPCPQHNATKHFWRRNQETTSTSFNIHT